MSHLSCLNLLQDQKDEDFRQKIENNHKQAEETTAKKRAKRLKKKEIMKVTGKKQKPSKPSEQETSGSSDASDTDNEPEDKTSIHNTPKNQ